MTSSTYLPAAAALLLLAFAQSASAAEPHSSSRIGTGSGHPQTSTASGASTSAHWSARIGTGRTFAESSASSMGGVSVPAHWSAQIGTGKASPVVNVRKVDRAQVLGEHPAVLVAQSWNNRSIDPNTFIVRHPAGPAWVSTSPTAVKVASVN